MSDCVWLVDEGRFVRGLNRGRQTRDGRTVPHWGLDVSAQAGTPARAVRDGRVLWVGRRTGYGLTVAIQHDENLSTMYAHLQSASVAEGQDVHAGDVVGLIGRSTAGPDGVVPTWGRTMGVHLHWEVHPRARPSLGQQVARTDPVSWLRNNGVAMLRSECPRAPAAQQHVTCRPEMQTCLPTAFDQMMDEWYMEDEEAAQQCRAR